MWVTQLPVEYLYNDVVGSITTSLLYVCLLLYLYTFYWICVLQVLTLYTAHRFIWMCANTSFRNVQYLHFLISKPLSFLMLLRMYIKKSYQEFEHPDVPHQSPLCINFYTPLFDWRSEQITSKNAGKSMVHGRKWQEGIWKRCIFPRLTRAQDMHRMNILQFFITFGKWAYSPVKLKQDNKKICAFFCSSGPVRTQMTGNEDVRSSISNLPVGSR